MKNIFLLILFVAAVLCHRNFQAHEATIESVHQAILNKDFTCTEIIKAHFERIYKYDGKLRSVINKLETIAYRRARQLDQYFENNGRLIGPLHCVPIAAKDNYDVADAPTTGGVKAFAKVVPRVDSPVVASLHSKGAITIAKVALPDFSGDGYRTISSINGLTLNPYNYNITTYGSSGGTGSSIAASFAVIGLGSDTSGSIQNPTSATNLVGLRPTFGLVPSIGILPLYFNQDSCGPMTRTVTDLAKTLEHMVNPVYKQFGPQNYVDYLLPNALQGARIGLEFSFLANITIGSLSIVSTQEIVDRFNEAAGIFRNAGATTVSSSVLASNYINMLNVRSLHSPTFCDIWTFKTGVEQHLSNIPNATFTSLSALFASGQSTYDLVEKSAKLDPSVGPRNCDAHIKARKQFADDLERMMNELDVDFLAYPSQGGPMPLIELTTFVPDMALASEYAASSGLPALNIPLRLTSNGGPIGMTLLGRKFQEAKLISYAYAFQNQHNFRVPPPNTPPLPTFQNDYNDNNYQHNNYNNHNNQYNNNNHNNNNNNNDEDDYEDETPHHNNHQNNHNTHNNNNHHNNNYYYNDKK